MNSSHLRRSTVNFLSGFLLTALIFSQISFSNVQSAFQLKTPAVVESPVFYLHFSGPAELASYLVREAASPLSLASADLDEDGMPDVVAGYGNNGRGLLTVQRGNVDTLYPNSPEAKARLAAGAFMSAPLLPAATGIELPSAPDLLAGGDFDGDGHADVLAGRLGGDVLSLLSGDGRGGFLAQRAIALPGNLTSLKAGEFDMPDGVPEILAGVAGNHGPRLVIFSSGRGALRHAQPEEVSLPVPLSDLGLGLLDGDALPDAAAIGGSQLFLIHGRQRDPNGSPEGPLQVETRQLPFQAVALAAGSFSGEGPELAIQAVDGQVFRVRYAAPLTPVLPQGSIQARVQSEPSDVFQAPSVRQSTPADAFLPLAEWKIEAVENGPAGSPAGRLVTVRGAANGADALGLLPLAASGQAGRMVTLQAASGGADLTTRALAASQLPALAAGLSLRLTPDARQSLVFLAADQPLVQVLRPDSVSFAVNRTSDEPDANLSDGICDANLFTTGSQCTLRAAIAESNASGGPATITFSIGTGPQKISPSSQLPDATVALTLDATSQPGYSGTPLIQLSGDAASGASSLAITNGSLVRGLVIGNFDKNGLIIKGLSGGNIVEGNYFGTDPSGASSNPNGKSGGASSGFPAIAVVSPNNTIGGTVAAARNLISGNNGAGVGILDAVASGNLVAGNYIGTNAAGTSALGNGLNGVAIDCLSTGALSGHNNTVGGLTAGAANVISANHGAGVAVECAGASGNLVQGNLIGTDWTGLNGLGGSTSAAGVLLWANFGGSVTANTVGGSVPGARNVIAGNTFDGMRLGADVDGIAVMGNFVLGNYIGVGLSGLVVPNQRSGIRLDSGANANTIGGTRVGLACTGPSNVISGNLLDGLALSGANQNQVLGNCIGVGANGTSAIPNGNSGVRIDSGSSSNIIGGDRASGVCKESCNTISSNSQWGVTIAGAGTTGNTVRGNEIYLNGKLGINIAGGLEQANGVSANNPTTSFPVKPNDLMYHPVGVMAQYDPATNQTVIVGVLPGEHPETATVDLYTTQQVDPSGFGQGKYYLGKVTPAASGTFRLNVAGVLSMNFVSATATNAGGSTSEFGPVCRDPVVSGKVDADGDGLCDDWELQGIDFNGDGVADLSLNTMGADSRRKDLFVEVDYMEGFKPADEVLPAVVSAFNAADVPSIVPGGTSGIALHFVGADPKGYLDESVPHAKPIRFDTRGPNAYDDFQDIKLGNVGNPCSTNPTGAHFGKVADRSAANCLNIIGAKGLVFRYALFADTFAEDEHSSGIAQLPGLDFMVTVGNAEWINSAAVIAARWSATGTTAAWEFNDTHAATFMHEMGHTLNLHHGGADENNCKPNYLSIMSYLYQFNNSGWVWKVPGFPVDGKAKLRSDRPLNYSGLALSSLNKDALVEANGVGAPAGRMVLWPDLNGISLISPGGGWIDWNTDRVQNAGTLAGYFDVNWKKSNGGCPANTPPSGSGILAGYNDWSNLIYNFRISTSYQTGGNLPRSPLYPAQVKAILHESNAGEYLDGGLGSIDEDEDSILNRDDNCPLVANLDQQDTNGDDIGNACSIAGLTFSPAQIAPGQTATASVTLVKPAPAGGAYLELSITTPGVVTGLPANLTVPAGATLATFTLQGLNQSQPKTVSITARWAAHTLTSSVAVKPLGSWTPAANMSSRRGMHTATLLKNGKVLVVGGYPGTTLTYLNPEIYDPTTNTWADAGKILNSGYYQTNFYNHTATLLQSGQVLVVGGQIYPGIGISNASMLYNPDTNSWSNVSNHLHSYRVNHTATLLPNGQVLVAGGNIAGDQNPSLKSTEIYDPASNAWSQAADMIYPRQNHFAIRLLSGKVLVGSGTYQDGFLLRSTELYDPVNNTWTQSGDMLNPHLGVTPVLLADGQVLVVAGNNNAAWYTAEAYNPQTGTWHSVANTAYIRWQNIVTLLNNGQVLVTGGDSYFRSIDNQNKLYCLIYDPQTNTWSDAALLNQAHLNAAGVLLQSGKVLLTGGYDYTDPNLYDPMNGVYTKASEIYLPPGLIVLDKLFYLPGVYKDN